MRHIVTLTDKTTPESLSIESQPKRAEAPPKRSLSTRQIFGRAFAILFVVAITVTIIAFAPYIQRFRYYGYPGVFLISLIANASIILPVPSLAVTFTMGAVLEWPLVGLVAGIGEALGELTGYLAGFGGAAVVENRKVYNRLQYWMENHGMLTIFILSAIPNPFFDLAGITAGAAKYSVLKFLLAAWLGKTIKTCIFAWAGAHSVTWILQYFG